MALTWPHHFPTLTRSASSERTAGRAAVSLPSAVADRLHVLVNSPAVALVVMTLGLVGLFVVPMFGLPFVALVVLPLVVHQLRAEQRRQYRLGRR